MSVRPGWLTDDDPSALPNRVARVLAVLERETGEPCPGCAAVVCGHVVLFSIAAGHEDAPLCMACLAGEIGRERADARNGLFRFVLSKECLRRGWRLADLREGTADGRRPACLWRAADAPEAADVAPEAVFAEGVSADAAAAPPEPSPAGPPAAHDDAWDAGALGCGELVLELRLRLRAMEPGAVMRLTALDPGAPEDLPAWCGLTGNALVAHDHPLYWIRRKE